MNNHHWICFLETDAQITAGQPIYTTIYQISTLSSM